MAHFDYLQDRGACPKALPIQVGLTESNLVRAAIADGRPLSRLARYPVGILPQSVQIVSADAVHRGIQGTTNALRVTCGADPPEAGRPTIPVPGSSRANAPRPEWRLGSPEPTAAMMALRRAVPVIFHHVSAATPSEAPSAWN